MRRIRISACEWTTTSLNRPTTRRASAAFGRPAREERMRALIISLICWLFIGPGAVATSQSQDPPDLIVRLRDVNGVGIAGVTVIVRDETGGRELARARTDAQGIASFAGLTENAVRVAVEGALPSGTRLYQLGNDVQGIALLLSEPPTHLDLRSEADGMVIPDSATMIAPDTGVPANAGGSVAVLPTAPVAVMTRHARVHTCSQRRCCQALLGLFVPLLALWPCVSWAACGVQDPGGCVDAAMYSFWYGLAGLGWSIDRTLLLLAYQLDTFRWWLVEVAFSSAYQVLVQIIDPLILPFATLAVIVGCLAFLLLPLFGRTNLVNIRHALVWTVFAPLLLSISGPMIVQLEQLRSDIGTALFNGVSAIAPGAIFGAAASDMRAPTPLYPANPCGNATLARQAPGGLRMDDLAAAMLWADAEDIHCPDRGGPSEDIPDLFFEAAPTGPGYARDEDVSQMDAGNDRTQ